MNEVEKLNVRKASEWLAGEIEIRMPKLWLAIGGIALLAMLLVALD